MTSWLADQRLGAFAVRVLSRIGRESQHAHAVREALESVELGSLTDPVAQDVIDAIGLLPRPEGTGRTPRAHAEPWPGHLAATPLELRFHEAMLEVFKLAGEATRRKRPDGTFARGYWAIYFLRAVRNHGGLVYARRLLHRRGTTVGFERLKKEGRLDLTMETLVLRPEYASLFTADELSIASRRIGGLRAFGGRTESADG